MQMRINGEERDVQSTDVSALLQELGLDPQRIAVEWNRHILRQSDFAQTVLAAGDTIEIVQFVGGGQSLPSSPKDLP